MNVFSEDIPVGSPVVVVLVTMDGCGACEEYKPIFERVAQGYVGKLPILEVDAESDDPETMEWMERNHVDATPTVIVALKGRGAIARIEGVTHIFETRRIFDTAVLASKRSF